ncbi:hypothetical protein SODG_005384 [Sodalis praecaptivus]
MTTAPTTCSQYEIYRKLIGNPHSLDFDLRFAALLVYIQVLPTLVYVKSNGTSGSPVISPTRWRLCCGTGGIRSASMTLGYHWAIVLPRPPIFRLAARRR